MKFFTNKSIWTKIVIVLIFIILFQFIVVKPVQAAESGSGSPIESILLKPIISLFVGIGDAIMGLLHSAIMGQDAALNPIDLNADWFDLLKNVTKIIIGVLVAGVALAFAYATGGSGIPVSVMLGKAAAALIGTVVVLNLPVVSDIVDSKLASNLNETGSKVSVSAYSQDALPVTLQLPLYTYSAEEIFQGKILLFNVNFFTSSEKNKIYTKYDDVEVKDEEFEYSPNRYKSK